jgi:hypothetical protein
MKPGLKQRPIDAVKELGNITLRGQKMVQKPREVMKALRQFLNLMRSDQYKRASYPSNLDKNTAAVTNALLKEITSLYNKGKIDRLEIPKDKKLIGFLAAAVKTDVSVRASLKSQRRIIATTPAPVKRKKPMDRKLVYDITLKSPGRREAFTYRVGVDTRLPTNKVFEYNNMKKAIASTIARNISITRGNMYVAPSEFKKLMGEGKVVRVRSVRKKAI